MSLFVKYGKSIAPRRDVSSGGWSTWAVPAIAGIGVGISAAALPLTLVVMSFTGVLVLLLSVVRPDLALCLFFCGILMLTDSGSFGGGDFFAVPDFDIITGLPSALKTFFLFLFCVTSARYFIERRGVPVSFRALGIYFPILLLSLATGFVRGAGRDALMVDFMDLLLPVLCFYFCIAILNSRERIYRLLYILMAVASFKAAILSAAYLAGHGWHYDTYRVVTTDSADLLAFITLGLIAFHLLLRGDLKGIRAGLVGAACLPMLFAVIFSFRRAQWGGAVASLGLLFWGAARPLRRRMVFFGIISLVAAGSLALMTGAGKGPLDLIALRLASIVDGNQSSNVYHREESKQVLADLSKTPLLGLGLGIPHTRLDIYGEADTISPNIVHNTFLYIWMKTGMSGFIFLAWGFFLYARRILRFRKTSLDSESWGMVLPLAASAGLWLAMFLTGPTIWYFHQTSLIALFAAMGISRIRLAGQAADRTPELPL